MQSYGKKTDYQNFLCNWNFIYPFLVPSAFKEGIKECLNDFYCQFVRNEPCWQGKHICVVMRPRELRKFGHPAQCRAYALVLVCRHVDTVARTADDDSEVIFARLDSKCQGVGIVGIITTVLRVRAEVVDLNVLVLKIAGYGLLHCKSGVI